MGVRGFLYSIALLLFIIPIVFFISNYFAIASANDYEATIGIRGSEFASFVNSISSDLPRALLISGRNSVASAVSSVTGTGAPLDDAALRLEELALNGTLYGHAAMNASLSRWAQRVQEIGRARGFETRMVFESLNARQLDSFSLEFSATVSINISDRVSSMNVFRTRHETALLPINGFEDPLYALETNGIMHRVISEANETVYGVAGVDRAIAQKYYLPAGDGASFLDRLEGATQVSEKYANLSQQPIGLETFVDVQELLDNGLEIKQDRTVVDHLYFNETAPPGYAVNGSQYPLFRIDAEHAALYGVNGSLAG
ncbi:MAG: hypothetical protein NTY90_01605 [Candidatus Micrarchaeota archaeon]|nr:hypothetical protein [Candidatus Micrarchaeota archaeon]